MKCVEARKLLRPYLDSELDAKSSLEVEQHLEVCAECAGLFDAEEKFDHRLNEALRQGPRTPALWAAVESRLEPAPVPHRSSASLARRFSAVRRWWPVAAAVAFALLAGFALWTRAQRLDLAAAVEECHEAYVKRITSPEFTGAVPDEIARKLGPRLDRDAFAFRPISPAFDAVGARLCHVGEVPVALILGQFERVPVSMIVLKKSELEHFPKTKRRLESGQHPIVCGRTGRYQFAARLVDGHVVCLIGDTPRPRLEDLLKTVMKPG